MTLQQAFPDYDNAEEFALVGARLPDPFTDSTYHNDGCPSYYAECAGGSVQLFVDYANPELREFTDTPRDIRFHVVVMNAEGDMLADKSFATVQISTAFASTQFSSLAGTLKAPMITPAYIMARFPNILVTRQVQGNAFAVSHYTPRGRDIWTCIGVAHSIESAHALAIAHEARADLDSITAAIVASRGVTLASGVPA